MKNKKWNIFAIIMSVCLFSLPIEIGVGRNADIPIIGHIEKLSAKQVDRTLVKAGAAYTTLKTIQTVPKIFEESEIPIFKTKVGAFLSPIVEQLDLLDSVLCYALMVAFGEKFLLGWFTYVSLIILLPLGLMIYGISGFVRLGIIKALGVFLAQMGVLLYLLLPTTALINQSIYNAYNVEQKVSSIENEAQELKVKDNKDKSWWDSIKEWAEKVVNAINPMRMVDGLNKMLNSFMEMIAVFVLTTVIIPIGVFFVFLNLFRRIFTPQIAGISQNIIEEIQKPSRKMEELLKQIQENTKNQEKK